MSSDYLYNYTIYIYIYIYIYIIILFFLEHGDTTVSTSNVYILINIYN